MSKKDKLLISGLFLKHSLDFLGEVIKKSTSLPIIENIKFVYESNTVFLTATNMDITLTIKLECQTESKGICLIDYKKLREIVEASGMGDIHIEVLEKTVNISEDDGTTYSLGAMNPDEYITLPKLKEDHDEIVFVGNPFKEYYKALSPMRSAIELEQIFQNVALVTTPPTLVCSDKNIVGYATIQIAEEKELKKPIFFTDSFASLMTRVKLRDDDNLVLKNDGNIYYVEYSNITMTGKTIDFKMPDYISILPKKKDCIKFSMKKSALESAIRKAKVIGNIGRFDLSKKDNPILTIEKREQGQKTKVPLILEADEKLRSFTVKLTFLKQSLALINDEDIDFYYVASNPTGGIRLTSPNKPHLTTFVMPIADKDDAKEAAEYGGQALPELETEEKPKKEE